MGRSLGGEGMKPKTESFFIAIAVVITIAGLVYVFASFRANSNAPHIKDQLCRQEAHDLGYRFLDYDHTFGECWTQRPDGSIVDLFKEAEP